MKKVLVAMSGGVDSSVAAALLQRQGYAVVGCFMRLGSPGEELDDQACDPRKVRIGHQGCCSINDAKDAQLVAAHLDIPLYVLNFKRDFGRVIDYFVSEYNAGRTPNPCVRCNDWLKFGKLWDYARSIDADYVASGHYARLLKNGNGALSLCRGVDRKKDQSYVLFGARRENLAHTLLPIGEYEKPAIREMARELGLPVFDKPDSQEICFVPDNDYGELVRRRDPSAVRPGDVLDQQGQVVGRHEGHQRFTIGQRRGLGLARGVPLYVVQKDAQANTITVGGKDQLQHVGLTADQCNWLEDVPVNQPMRCQVKVRYNSPPAAATLTRHANGTMDVTFDQPLQAVAPGQAAVCYDGDVVLGGGWISGTRR